MIGKPSISVRCLLVAKGLREKADGSADLQSVLWFLDFEPGKAVPMELVLYCAMDWPDALPRKIAIAFKDPAGQALVTLRGGLGPSRPVFFTFRTIFSITFKDPTPGTYRLLLTIDGIPVAQTPLTITVGKGPPPHSDDIHLGTFRQPDPKLH